MHSVISKDRATLQRPVEAAVGDQKLAQPTPQGDKQHTVWFWVALFAAFLGWNYLQHQTKIEKELKPENMRANIHNLMIITFGAVIGLVGGKILFTKLAAITKNVPFVGRACNYIAELFSAA